ncbi:MAG: HlyU family transcriptional regulator [Leucothrix sp.]
MGILSSFKSMFSGAPAEPKQPKAMPSEEYEGFEIIPMPAAEGGQYRLNGLIRKDGKEHQMIRADMFGSPDDCANEMKRKSKILIDQMGERLFG